ncbi:glutathione S-transferase [Lentibacter sp. XHP0401]|jgi:glutathione S-transferase|uniref:glutathione S-transferase n=1 Tax=Lentibacter sp. XHP0401 TaxID=2984334 RepID=UPI0021E8D54B|nr:glutathione S-transferase [Lentibacter sp. XHP0401]MCV2894043.1 glutathione S-transferase [Lentibacter sp. XHP0401]
MTYDLYIGDRAFSSWSLRGWLMLEHFGLPYRTHLVGLYAGTMAAELAPLAPARTVPALLCEDGAVLFDSLAMAEELATRHPEAPLWPDNPKARALARSMAAEMHSGFPALRGECPMQLFHQWAGFVPSDAVLKELERFEMLFSHAKAMAADGPWLFGAYSLADVFYAPLMARLAGYELPVSEGVATYVETTLTDPAFQTWRAEGITVKYEPFPYPQPLKTRDWPVTAA